MGLVGVCASGKGRRVEVLGVLLPLALGVALSSVPLTATIVILISPRARQSGPAFLAGWVIGLAIVTVGFILGISAIPSGLGGPNQTVVGAVELVLGLGLFGFGVWTIVHAPSGEKKPAPNWTKRLATLGPWPSFGLGLVLNIRPKAIALAIAAGLAIASVRLSTTELVVVLIIYILLGSSTVAIPVIMELVAPEATAVRLKEGRGWLSKNSRVISIVVSLMLGVLLIGDAIGRF